MVTASIRSIANRARTPIRHLPGALRRIDPGHDRRESSDKPQRVLFVNQYYWPDHASTAQHLTDLAESMAAKGNECHVLCGLGQYKTGVARRPSYEVHNGVHIHRVKVSGFGRRTTLHRMCDYLSYYVQALRVALTLKRFDLVITLTTPPLIGLIGTILKWTKGTRQIFWSMDLHPDASQALGLMKRTHPVVRLLTGLSDLIYRQADRVVVLGPYMADRILAKGVRPERVREVPVWSRREEIFPREREGHPLRAELGLDDKFVVMYSGNLGLAHRFEEVIDAAEALKGRSDIVFLFVGDGPRLKEVKAAAETKALPNVRFMDYFPRESLHLSLSVADTHLITMRDCMTGIVVPGKLYGAMASGRPTLFVGPTHCESADTIRDAGCGMTIPSERSDLMIEAILRLADQNDLAAELGQNGRRAFLRSYESRACCERWVEIAQELLGAPEPAVLQAHASALISDRIANGLEAAA
jgi:glycosyltransferase involved in cell wall biosynthesis